MRVFSSQIIDNLVIISYPGYVVFIYLTLSNLFVQIVVDFCASQYVKTHGGVFVILSYSLYITTLKLEQTNTQFCKHQLF